MDPNAERLLAQLLTGQQRVLGPDLVGSYLFGSLATGDFEPGISDVDTVAVLRSDLTEPQLKALDELHHRLITEMPEWEDRVEVVYLSTRALETFRARSSAAARISPGEPFHAIQVDQRWLIDWYQLREAGQVLYGPPATTLVPPIVHEEYVEAVRQHLLDWPDPTDEMSHGSLAYAVLTMCRGLRTIRTGDVVSKREAARWGAQVMPEHAELIRIAERWRERSLVEPAIGEEEAREATRRFIDHIQCSLTG